TVFAVADAHKEGDFSPYVFASDDRGRSWHAISGDLPAGTIVWALAQDHVEPTLLFLATEFGLYFTLNRGENWHKLQGNVPTISFRDLKLQRRENDVVGASFGRGFYLLDDYTPLRELAGGAFDDIEGKQGHLFAVRDAWWYIPYLPMQSRGQPSQGDSAFKVENPPFGATFTYYLPDKVLSQKEARLETEKKLREQGADVPFPGWERLHIESNETPPQVLLLVRDEAGHAVRWLTGPVEAGVHRVNWDLRLAPPDPIDLNKTTALEPWELPPHGPLAAPGNYSATLYLASATGLTQVGAARPFAVKPLPSGVAAMDFTVITAFQQQVARLARQVAGAAAELTRAEERLK
ncbi:MAG: hypothetical protein KDE53_39815, partial [Caldilineaceae bacterium]|nr:hypothetical protein [Caldilineaceae bacterium]